MRLSLCMIVRNEARYLARCLASVEGLVDERVVVDTGSTDGTQNLARELGARVIEVEWRADFAKARNEALEQARGEWILALDADETLLEKDRNALAELVLRDPPPRAGYNLLQKNSSDGGRTAMYVSIVRLFPNDPSIRYEWPIHEQVATSLIRRGLPIRDTSIEILHDGYSEGVRNQEKQRRNLAILQRQVNEGREVYPLTYFLLAGTYLDLGRYDEALANYRESVRRAGVADPIAAAARVRIGTCLVALGRYVEALAELPEATEGETHPELLQLRGRCELGLGQPDRARVAFARIFSCGDRPFVPPCNLASVKMEAIASLAQLLKQEGRPAEALALMRGALARRAAGEPLTDEWLARMLAQS